MKTQKFALVLPQFRARRGGFMPPFRAGGVNPPLRPRPKLRDYALALVLGIFCCGQVLGAEGWPTFAHDPQRSGWAFEETTLSPQNVSKLELLWKTTVKNEPKSLTALTAPVLADGVSTPSGVRPVVYIAGSSDEVYAIDAINGKLVWARTLKSDVLPKDAGMWLCPNNLNATPVIDESRGLLYVVASDGKFYGLDLSTGRTKLGPVQFVPPFSKDWSLNLWNGIVYTSISQGCGNAISGIYSFDVRHPERPVVRDLLLETHGGGGVWGRGGPTIGKDGRIFAQTGDGVFDPSDGQYGSSVIAASLGSLKLVDYFSPRNFRQLTQYDLDLGASGLAWFPYRNFDLVAGGGKEGVLYLLDADDLGTKDHQTPLCTLKLGNDNLDFEGAGIWGALSSWRDTAGDAWVYVPIWGPASKQAPAFSITNGPHPHGSIMAFKIAMNSATREPTLDPVWVSGDFDVPEPVAIANGVVFALSTGENTQQTTGNPVIIYPIGKLLTDQQRGAGTRHAVLYALDARTGKVLYDSGDVITDWVHFSGLAISGGRVYVVDHDSTLYCFGLKSQE
ncbi:MAG: PQQ-binding-like beta-propeller repeat protein [Terriglobia bacterium]